MRSVEGGRHPGWGTANRIIPLGDSYLELVSVIDEREARASQFGRWVAAGETPTGRAIGWAVRPDDLDATAAQLGLEISRGSRARLSGERIEWLTAGIDMAARRPWLPFFIAWADTATFPGTTATPHAAVTRLEIEGDPDELSAWLGEHALPIDVKPGNAGITAVLLDGPRGALRLGGYAE